MIKALAGLAGTAVVLSGAAQAISVAARPFA